MKKRGLILAFAALFAGLASAHAQGEIQVRLPSMDGRERVIEGSRLEIANAAQKFAEQGNYEYAKRCYQRLIETDPGDVRSVLLLGQLYQAKLGKYADAIRLYKRAERLVPESNPGGRIYVWRLTAEAYRELAEKTNSLIYFVQAISEYDKILEKDPKNVEVMYYVGLCRMYSRDYETAIEMFKRVLATEPKGEWADVSRKALEVAQREFREKKRRG